MIQVPQDRLRLIRQQLGIDDSEFEILDPFVRLFVQHKGAFAESFHRFFTGIPETAVFLEHSERPEFLPHAWAHWFGQLFTSRLDEAFCAYLWRIGIRHVEVNLDQRFTNLGFSVVRQYCQKIIAEEVPPGLAGSVSRVVDKLLDFCLLVETSAYVAATTRCDLEVIKGIADKVRNPITVIGGNVRRLKRKVPPEDPSQEIYASLIEESRLLERMVLDIKTYTELFQREPDRRVLPLAGVLSRVLEQICLHADISGIRIETAISEEASSVFADEWGLRQTLYYLVENGIESLDPAEPVVRITSGTDPQQPHNVRIEIFNTGAPPKPEEAEKMFSPFYSTKSHGTGFGLPIARLAAIKNYGVLSIGPAPVKGAIAVVILPAPS